MLQIPGPIFRQFTNYNTQQGIPSGQHGYYLQFKMFPDKVSGNIRNKIAATQSQDISTLS
jgi:hypothetical protein